jgi:transcription elongation GreA/GreB family factor
MLNISWEDRILSNEKISIIKKDYDYNPLLEKSDLSSLESVLLERIETSPQDIDFFLPAYNFLIKKKQSDILSTLVQLHSNSLFEKQENRLELRLLKFIYNLWPDFYYCRERFIFYLKNMYYECSPNYDKFYNNFNVAKSSGIDVLYKFETWLRYDEGRIVYSTSLGAGIVKEINLSLEIFRVAFEKSNMHSFKLEEIQRLCNPLSPKHFLSKKFLSLKEILEITNLDPSKLLSLIFSGQQKSLLLSEFKDYLFNIIPEENWSSFWSLVKKDKRITISTDKNPIIYWNDSAENADTNITKMFISAEPLEKIKIYKQYSERSKELKEFMLKNISTILPSLKNTNPEECLEILCSLNNEIYSTANIFPQDILLTNNPIQIVPKIKDKRARKLAFELLNKYHKDWNNLFVEFLKIEEDMQILSYLYDSLAQNKDNLNNLILLIKNVMLNPEISSNLFLWICREFPKRKELSQIGNVDFLLTLIKNIDKKIFKGNISTLKKVFDNNEAFDLILENLSDTDCANILDSIDKSIGIEDFRKSRIKDLIYRKYPKLKGEKKEFIYSTKEKIEEKRQELKRILEIDLPQNSKEIQRTREYGDLRENFEYHAARQRQEMLSLKAKSLAEQLTNTREIIPTAVDTSKVSIGTKIYLKHVSDSSKNFQLIILGPWDSDPLKNIISYTSSAATQLLGAKCGQKVEYDGGEYIIEKIEVWNA